MSERKGGDHLDDKRKAVQVPVTAHEKLLKYTQSKMKSTKGINMGVVLAMFIDKCVDQDLYDPQWAEKLAASERVIAAYASSEGLCHRHASGENKEGVVEFSCVAYSEEGVVRVKNLGKTPELRDGKCSACGLDKKYKAGILVKDRRIADLETRIQRKAKQTNKVPICNGGAILTQEGTAFRSCRKRPGQIMNIQTVCRKLSAGQTLPCALFAEVELAEGPR